MTDRAEFERLRVPAIDGYPLVGRRYHAGAAASRILVSGATAVPQGFYRAFALHAQARGFEVITFDYRGIGDSAPPSLRGFEMDYRDWGRLDLAAIIATCSGSRPIDLLGHSFGGQALGLLPDPSAVRSLYALGSGSGWHGWMPWAERWRVRFLWNVLGPLAVRTSGYLAWSRVGLGEDLPRDVYRQWKQWCRYPEYWFQDPEAADEMSALFARVRVPITAVNAVDDRWSSPAARDAFFSHYVNAPVTTRDLRPADLGLRGIGHMGYFRRGSERLWDQVLNSLEDPS